MLMSRPEYIFQQFFPKKMLAMINF